MVDTNQYKGPLPEHNPNYWSVLCDIEEYLNPEAIAWLDWIVRTQYAQLRGLVIGSSGESIRITMYWVTSLDLIFSQTPSPAPERVDTLLDRIVERAGFIPLTPQDRRHNGIEFTINKPKAPAHPRDALWLSRRMRMEFKKLNLEHEWPAAGLKAFNLWLQIDGKDIYIPRLRDLEAEPLSRRVRVRNKNGQQAENPHRVDPDIYVGKPVLSRRRRIRLRR